MGKQPRTAPIEYHELTKHTPASVRTYQHRLDFTDQPQPFKIYTDVEVQALPSPAPDTGFPATTAITEKMGPVRTLDAPELARLLTLAAGVHRVFKGAGDRPVYCRTYACAGALYPVEVYVAVGNVEGVEPGLYHYSPLEDGLRLLRAGDPRPHLLRATGGRESVGAAPASVILSGIMWRTAWKYRARGYRHLWWDAGMILANLLALAASGGHDSEVLLGFDDAAVDRLLGIDGRREMTLCIAPLGSTGPAAQPAADLPPALDLATMPISHFQRDYDEVVDAHAQTALNGPLDAQMWAQDPWSRPVEPPELSDTGIEKTIRRRGSKRKFNRDRAPITKGQFAGCLEHATHYLACDWGEQLIQPAAILHNVEGVAPGAYACIDGLDPIELGDLRSKAQFLCLDQSLGGDGAATVFLLTDFVDAARTLGRRSYRAAQLNAGIVGGRLYLSAYACGFGATGLTFFDDEVREFFRTAAEPMLVIALGR